METNDYLTLIQDIPRQYASIDEQKAVEGIASSAESAATSAFAFSLGISLLLNGILSQLWNIFNTLQIIMALPLLAVIMPAAVITVG